MVVVVVVVMDWVTPGRVAEMISLLLEAMLVPTVACLTLASVMVYTPTILVSKLV